MLASDNKTPPIPANRRLPRHLHVVDSWALDTCDPVPTVTELDAIVRRLLAVDPYAPLSDEETAREERIQRCGSLSRAYWDGARTETRGTRCDRWECARWRNDERFDEKVVCWSERIDQWAAFFGERLFVDVPSIYLVISPADRKQAVYDQLKGASHWVRFTYKTAAHLWFTNSRPRGTIPGEIRHVDSDDALAFVLDDLLVAGRISHKPTAKQRTEWQLPKDEKRERRSAVLDLGCLGSEIATVAVERHRALLSERCDGSPDTAADDLVRETWTEARIAARREADERKQNHLRDFGRRSI